jgi:hypothetical protein
LFHQHGIVPSNSFCIVEESKFTVQATDATAPGVASARAQALVSAAVAGAEAAAAATGVAAGAGKAPEEGAVALAASSAFPSTIKLGFFSFCKFTISAFTQVVSVVCCRCYLHEGFNIDYL